MKQHENIKNSTFAKASSSVKTSEDKSIDKQILKLTHIILPAFRNLGVVGIFVFLFLNIISSQIVSPIYFQIINYNQKSVTNLLQKIKSLPEYQNILEMNNNIYGKTIKETISRQENEKKIVINNLEQILTKNPKARDILYSLYRLNLAEGNNNRAEEYLRQAKEVDPELK